ncbi:MAG: putative molybdenum carrier protein [Pseudomonadota bacterium]
MLKLVSGGQTGVDMAALNFAIRHGMPYGGWVPRGRTNEAGRIPQRYQGLQETASADVAHRTRMNVRTSDATVIFTDGSASGGTDATADFARDLGKPFRIIDTRGGVAACAAELDQWMRQTPISVLNIAGPRASEAPGLDRLVTDILERVLLD